MNIRFAEKFSDPAIRRRLDFVLEYLATDDCACGGTDDCVHCYAKSLRRTLFPQVLPLEEAVVLLEQDVAGWQRRDWEKLGCPEHHEYTAIRTVLDELKSLLARERGDA